MSKFMETYAVAGVSFLGDKVWKLERSHIISICMIPLSSENLTLNSCPSVIQVSAAK